MKRFIACAFFLALATSPLPAADAPAKAPWYAGGGYRPPPPPDPKAKALPLISVAGNRFVNPKGETVLFRGASIADPHKLLGQGQWKQEIFKAVHDMGANVIRLPIHPVAWRELGREEYFKLLDQAVRWSTDLGMYVIVDWHSIGNLKAELFQNPMYDTSRQETLSFWRAIAQRYKDHNTVAFYELFNEPTHFNGMLGTMTWTEWKELNEEMITVIRYWDKETIPLVAGFDWAYELTPIRTEPVRAAGIGYVSHPYDFKRGQPWEPRWEENFAFAAASYPVMVTEFGFGIKEGEKVGDDHYGNRITRFLEQRGISWVSWCFDPQWGPAMLKSFDGYQLNGSGEFFSQAMRRPAAIAPAKP